MKIRPMRIFGVFMAIIMTPVMVGGFVWEWLTMYFHAGRQMAEVVMDECHIHIERD